MHHLPHPPRGDWLRVAPLSGPASSPRVVPCSERHGVGKSRRDYELSPDITQEAHDDGNRFARCSSELLPRSSVRRRLRGGRVVTAVRVLGACGLLAAFCSALAGFMDVPFLLGLSGAVMVVGNVYAIVAGRRDRSAR